MDYKSSWLGCSDKAYQTVQLKNMYLNLTDIKNTRFYMKCKNKLGD